MAPAVTPFFTHAPLTSALPPALEQGLQTLLQRIQRDGIRLTLEELNKSSSINLKSSTELPIRPRLHHFAERIDPASHPLLAALAASSDGSRLASLGDGLLRAEASGSIANPLFALPAQGFVSATMLLVHNESANAASSLSASGLALSSTGDFAGLPTQLPLLAESLGFSPFNSLALMTPANDRSIVFELSPYAPAAPDIVPIPVPHGLDDWFAELFGTPAPVPVPGDTLGASDDSSDALREAVLQMLHAGGTLPPTIGVLSPPVQAETFGADIPPHHEVGILRVPSRPDRGEDAKRFRATSQAEQESRKEVQPAHPEAAKLTAGSLLGLFAAGLVRAVRRRQRPEAKRQLGKVGKPISAPPKASPSL